MNISYQPKGGMCAVCSKKKDNCASLDFKNMPLISKVKKNDTVAIVKCTSFIKNGTAAEF